MELAYLSIVVFLFVLAIVDLVVGVSNDAVNFTAVVTEIRKVLPHLSKE